MTCCNRMIQRLDDIAVVPFSQSFVDVSKESAWKFLRRFPLADQQELDLMNVSQQILKSCRPGCKQRKIFARRGDKSKIHGHEKEMVGSCGSHQQRVRRISLVRRVTSKMGWDMVDYHW